MDNLYQGAPDVHVIPASLNLPGIGVLPVNAYLLMAEEPVLIDTGLGVDVPGQFGGGHVLERHDVRL